MACLASVLLRSFLFLSRSMTSSTPMPFSFCAPLAWSRLSLGVTGSLPDPDSPVVDEDAGDAAVRRAEDPNAGAGAEVDAASRGAAAGGAERKLLFERRGARSIEDSLEGADERESSELDRDDMVDLTLRKGLP